MYADRPTDMSREMGVYSKNVTSQVVYKNPVRYVIKTHNTYAEPECCETL